MNISSLIRNASRPIEAHARARRQFLWTACGAVATIAATALPTSYAEAAKPMTPEVKLVDDYNTWFLGEAFDGDFEKLKAGLAAYITNASVLHEPVSLPWGGTMVGYEGWVRLCKISTPIFAKLVDQMEFSQPTYYQRGNVVLHELAITFKPTHEGSPPFVAAIMEKYEIEKSRIKQIDEFWADTASLLSELKARGVISASGN